MTEQTPTTGAPRRRHWVRYLIAGVAVTAAVAVGAFKIVQYRSDGPLTAMIPGGPLREGTRVTDRDIDWPAVLGDAGRCVDGVCAPMEPVPLQLEDPPLSRYTGIMVHDGELYVPCDLGYMWGRFSGRQRTMLHLIYLFKTWHQDAMQDGRAVLRIGDKLYERQAVRVTDPELIAALKSQLEKMARQWVAPDPLADAPTEGPRDIWFFRMDPRPL